MIDTKGTATEEDDVEVDFLFQGQTGNWQTSDRDFCEDLTEFIG